MFNSTCRHVYAHVHTYMGIHRKQITEKSAWRLSPHHPSHTMMVSNSLHLLEHPSSRQSKLMIFSAMDLILCLFWYKEEFQQLGILKYILQWYREKLIFQKYLPACQCICWAMSFQLCNCTLHMLQRLSSCHNSSCKCNSKPVHEISSIWIHSSSQLKEF